MDSIKKAGRPKIIDADKRRHEVNAYLTAHEYAEAKAQAEASDRSLSAWVRSAIVSVLPKKEPHQN